MSQTSENYSPSLNGPPSRLIATPVRTITSTGTNIHGQKSSVRQPLHATENLLS
jgi:hypothetical protein